MRLATRAFPGIAPRAIECAAAVLLVAIVAGARLLLDRVFPGTGAPALIFPAIAAATLLGGGAAGALVMIGGQLPACHAMATGHGGSAVAGAHAAAGLAFATIAQLLLLWCVARHRRARRDTAALQRARYADPEEGNAPLREQGEPGDRVSDQATELRATRKKLEAIYEASGDGLALCEATFDADGHVVEYQVIEVNRAHAELTAASREQMLAEPVSTIYPPIDPRWFETAEKVLKTGIMHDFDIRSRATGRWLNIRVSRVSDTLFQQTFVDVSDRHRLDEQRRALLSEMSHRVMNNFQMIAGFLHIQAAAADRVAREQLKTAERRVQVLANLHSILAYSESEGDIDAAAYMTELCGYLGSTFDRPEAVTLICEVDRILLPPDKVVALGFVISELATNSAKYAYPPPVSGTIRVTLRALPDGWILVIRDQGQGFGTAGWRAAGGLGTRLVQRFVAQIGADLATTSDGGVRHEITYRNAA